MRKPCGVNGTQAIILALAAFGLSAAQGQTVEDGIEAWQTGRDDEAVRNWLPLAEAGDPEAQFQMGNAYRHGRGVPQNLRQAEEWYTRAAAQGHDNARTLRALLMLNNGRPAEAMPLIQQAAESGDPRAKYVLAVALFHGDYVVQDRARAYALMQEVARQGFPAADNQIREMEPQLTAEERSRAAAMMPQQMAAAATGQAAPPPAPAPAPVQTVQALPPQAQVQPEPVRQDSAEPALPPVNLERRPVAQQPALPRPAANGRWQVQLGALTSPEAARGAWSQIRRGVPALANFNPSYEPAGQFTRLRIGPFADRASAERICATVKASGRDCFAVSR